MRGGSTKHRPPGQPTARPHPRRCNWLTTCSEKSCRLAGVLGNTMVKVGGESRAACHGGAACHPKVEGSRPGERSRRHRLDSDTALASQQKSHLIRVTSVIASGNRRNGEAVV